MQTKKQTAQLCKDFIRMNCKDMQVNAIQAKNRMADMWGIDINWHEFSNALDFMSNAKEITPNGTTGDGLACYIITAN